MNERIREIRKTLDLSQAKFAEALGISGNFIWMVEKGERALSDRTIADICRVFRVNETWLRSGTGEMFSAVSDDEKIAAFSGRVLSSDPDCFMHRFVSSLASLNDEEWAVLEKLFSR